MRARSTVFSACLLLTAAVLAAQPGAAALTAADADRFAVKLGPLVQGAPTAGQAHPPKSTTVTEQELNAFLRLRGQALLPTGVLEPYYTRGDTYPQGVNLDAPVPLPAGIREITVHSGRAVIVQ